MAHEKILVVEDEADLIQLHTYNLTKEGYRVFTAANGEAALKSVREVKPDLIILDILLPGIDGLEVCKVLKQDPATRNIGIIMVTAKGEEPDVVTGLELGADDYVIKPFSPKVLTARIRNVLRHAHEGNALPRSSRLEVAGLTIDSDKFEVLDGEKPVMLSATEFAILRLFAENPGRVFSRGRIINAIKGEDYPVTERAVDVQILGLRKKLESRSSLIKTVRGIGYCLKED